MCFSASSNYSPIVLVLLKNAFLYMSFLSFVSQVSLSLKNSGDFFVGLRTAYNEAIEVEMMIYRCFSFYSTILTSEGISKIFFGSGEVMSILLVFMRIIIPEASISVLREIPFHTRKVPFIFMS